MTGVGHRVTGERTKLAARAAAVRNPAAATATDNRGPGTRWLAIDVRPG
jgi:hypothetical protein